MEETIAFDFRRPMPIFPLSGCVLLPHTAVPLQVFEPRYKQMVEDVIDSHGLIAMGLFSDEVDEDEYLHERPPLRDYACVGYILQYERVEDGRYLLLLHGICRGRIIEEVEHEPYRTVRLEPIDLLSSTGDDLGPQRGRLDRLLNDPQLHRLESVQQLHDLVDDSVPTGAVIDVAVMSVCPEVEQRYQILAEPDITVRADWLIDWLESTRRDLKQADDTGSDDFSWN
ncbi:MAG: LON peptidase substrate-binding domain-containing protein [Phycisphaerae bacterium]|nr:LON peptidase substrate-binding domain-containing protein [Phycisphaerae bacterium]